MLKQTDSDAPRAAVRRIPESARILLGFLCPILPFPLGALALKGFVLGGDWEGQWDNALLVAAGGLTTGIVLAGVVLRVARFPLADAAVASCGVGSAVSLVTAYLLMSASPPHNDPPPPSIWPDGIVEEQRVLHASSGPGSREVQRRDEDYRVLLRLRPGLSIETACQKAVQAMDAYGWSTDEDPTDTNFRCWIYGSTPNGGGWSVMAPNNLSLSGGYTEWRAEQNALLLVVY